MRKVLKICFNAISLSLAVIGLSGIPDNIEQWGKWVDSMPAIFTPETIRWSLVIFAIVFLTIINTPRSFWVKLRASVGLYPIINFDSPQQLASEPFVYWWHIAISLKNTRWSSSSSYEHCVVNLIFADRKNYPINSIKMRCQSDEVYGRGDGRFALRIGDDPVVVPIALRSLVQSERWDEGVAYMTGEPFLVHGDVIPVPPSDYSFKLQVRCSGKEWESPDYCMRVPTPELDNRYFEITKI